MTSPIDPLAAPDEPTGSRHRPWAWIAVCSVLALGLVGVTIWAIGLESDLDHQRDQTAAAQQQAEHASSAIDQLSQDVNDALDQAGQAGAAAKDKIQGELADLEDNAPPAATAEPAAPPAAPAATAVENSTPDGS
jgi:hypothetical protein